MYIHNQTLIMLTQKVSWWGNSLGLRLPQTLVQQVEWTEGTIVSITIEDNRLVLSPVKPKYRLEQLLENITPDMQHDEMEWGEAVGEETW
ncbi:transcriptional regulator/antitoxin, MazE [Crinalium epipsammum PCC 9333]|uniref:Transcriptional regulator/antitoxin, MazE n=2 Tax=Crinalium TaxID=241421 RepID=K9W150_9CYAN|nr:transcriptional regulator/antitoxin, MazE [Crinalium epipsammum PCC 9333]